MFGGVVMDSKTESVLRWYAGWSVHAIFWAIWGRIFWSRFTPANPDGHYIITFLALILAADFYFNCKYDPKVQAAITNAYTLWKNRRGAPIPPKEEED
jgi:hypothetical protein